MTEKLNIPLPKFSLRPISSHSSRVTTPGVERRRIELEQYLLTAARDNKAQIELLLGEYVMLTQRRLHQVAERITLCPHAAQDVVQESCITLYERLFVHNKPLEGCLQSWLIGVVANKSLQSVRNAKRRNALALRNAPEASAPPTPEDIMAKAEMAAGIWRHVTELPPQQRQALTLKYLDGWDWDQVGVFMDISSETARKHCYRALAKVRGKARESSDA